MLQYLACVGIEEHDLVRPSENDLAVIEDVEVGVSDPSARGVWIVDIGAAMRGESEHHPTRCCFLGLRSMVLAEFGEP